MAYLRAEAIGPGKVIHLGRAGACRIWMIVGEKQTDTLSGRAGWQAVEMNAEGGFEETTLIVYEDVLRSYHEPE